MKKEVSMGRIILLALGQLGCAFQLYTIGMYTLYFYAPTESLNLPLLLPIGAIGLVQGLSVAFDALIDPWIANVCDNSKNPKGRRMPFMRLAAIPSGLFCALVFFAPVNAVSWINVVWIIVMMCLYCLCRSFYDINLMALIPEIIPDTHKRTRYFTTTAFIMTPCNMLVSSVTGIVAILATSVSDLSAWQISLSVFPLLGVILMLLSVAGINETDYVERVELDQEKNSVIKSFVATLKNREFVVFMMGATAFGLAIGVFNAALLFMIDMLLELEATMNMAVYLILTLLTLILFIPVQQVSKKLGKRKMLLISSCVCASIFVLMYFHAPISDLLGTAIIGPDSFWVALAGEGAKTGNIALLLILGAMFAYPQAAGNVVGSSMFADIAQYDNMISGRNRTGMFMAVQSVIGVLPGTIVPAIVGFFIYLGSTNQMPTVVGVRSNMLACMVFIVLTFLGYFFYNEKKVFEVILPKGEAAAVPEAIEAAE